VEGRVVDQILKVQQARLGLKIQGVTVRIMRQFFQKNWWLIAAWFVIQLIGIYASYYTSEWVSVSLSLVVAVITFFLGLLAFTTVIKLTILS
jgi:hypothetical protein